jgi:hypothetical protein
VENLCRDIALVAAVNDQAVLERNLRSSPSVASGELRLEEIQQAPSASIGFNRSIARNDSPLLVFLHQDVYLPASWICNVSTAVKQLADIDPDWAVLGVYGVKADGGHVGNVWCSAAGAVLGKPLSEPVPVESVDELAFVVRRASGCLFDEKLPDFHLYGTDIIQIAGAMHLRSYVANLPVVHNSRPWFKLGRGYASAYNYMRRKWRRRLPLYTTVTTISLSGLPLWRQRAKLWRHYRGAERPPPSSLDPHEIAERMGWE